MNYIALSIPVFFFLIGVELVVGMLKKEKLYRFNDALTNINLGTGQQIIGVVFKGLLFAGYVYLYEHRIFDIERSWKSWLLLFLGVDFLYYWFHRLSHEVNALWAAHIVHHQSEDYNLSVALRQSWFQNWFSWLFYLPLAIIGFDPVMFATMNALNTLYQFWIHTTTIRTLGPLEWIINTPSHHRVHHGSNPKYIDRNHAGSLIIWDRLFGTFQKEEEEVVYGITKPLNSWNPIWANLHYWQELTQLARQAKGLDKLRVFLKPPGWQPEYLGGRQYAPEIDRASYRKFDEDGMPRHHVYVLFVFILSLALATSVLFLQSTIPAAALYATIFYVLCTLGINGGLMENRKWALQAEYGRIIATLPLALLFWELPYFDILLKATAGLTLLNLIWFLRIARSIRSS